MLPDDIWANSAGSFVTAIVDSFIAFFLLPLTALTADLLTFLIALIPF